MGVDPLRRKSNFEVLSPSKVLQGAEETAVAFNDMLTTAMMAAPEADAAPSVINHAIPFNANAHELVAQLDTRVAQVATEDSLAVDPDARRAYTADTVNEEILASNKLDVTPFQVFMDKAVDSLESISHMEKRVNDLIEQFIIGNVSIEEVSVEAAKLNLAVQFMTTVITTSTQTFKELYQIQI